MILSDADLEGKYWADDYRKWHAAEDVLVPIDRTIVSRLGYDVKRGHWRKARGIWKQEYDAAAELYTRSLFDDLEGFRFEFQPELQGKTPDFLMHNHFGKSVVADVTVLHGGPMSESAEQQDDYLILRKKIMEIETDTFRPAVFSADGSRSVKGQGGGQVSFDKLLRPVRKWIREQEETYNESPNFMPWQASPKGPCVMDYFTFADLDIDLQFDVYLYLKSEETDERQKIRRYEYAGDIGVASSFVDNTDDRLEVALKKKMSYLEVFEHPQSEEYLPYIVIIFSSSSFAPDREDIEKVLFGPSTEYALNSGPSYEDLRQWEQRANQELHSYSDGLFANRKKDLLAVLVCQGHIAFPESCEMSMWLNPYASYFSIPQSLYQLKTYTLNREIVCTPPA